MDRKTPCARRPDLRVRSSFALNRLTIFQLHHQCDAQVLLDQLAVTPADLQARAVELVEQLADPRFAVAAVLVHRARVVRAKQLAQRLVRKI